MRIVNRLSSQVGERGETANQQVAALCLLDPDLLVEIGECLESCEAALAGDCAEVMTLVAAKRPARVLPYASSLVKLLECKTARVRWEAMHSLAYISEVSPAVIAELLPKLSRMIQEDRSVIVRDYAVEAVAGYAKTSPDAAWAAFPTLKMSLGVWKGKHAGRALQGLMNAAMAESALYEEVSSLAQPYLEDPRGLVREAALSAIKATQAH
jgi:hypothetical protein